MAKPRKTFKFNDETFKIGDLVTLPIYFGKDNKGEDQFKTVNGMIMYILRENTKPSKADIKALYGENISKAMLEDVNKPIARTRIALKGKDEGSFLCCPVFDIKHLKAE